MEHSDEMIDCLPAKQLLEMIFATVDFYFPPMLRGRFEKIAEFFETKDQYYWLERAAAKRDALATAFRNLGEWVEMTDSTLLMSAWDDEVFFFYVLRTQFVFSRIAVKPDDLIPGTMEGFWKWCMTPGAKENCTVFILFTAQNLRLAPIKPPIWRIPYPHNFPT